MKRDRASLLVGVASVVGVIALWALLTNTGVLPTTDVPTPQSFVSTFVDFFKTGFAGTSGWTDLGISVFRAVMGIVIGLLLGIPVGLLMGLNKWVGAALAPLVSFLRPIPALAYIPLVVIYFGIGETSKIFVIGVAAFLYGMLNAAVGARSVPENFRQLGANLELSRTRVFWRIVLPSALPQVVAGIRTGTAIGWAVVVAAELIASHRGLGYMVEDAATFFRISYVYVGVFLIGLVGLAFEGIILFLERRYVHWVGKE